MYRTLFDLLLTIKHIYCLYLGKYTEAQFPPSIRTIPHLPDNTIATGYKELQVVSVFDRSNYNFCAWIFNDQVTASRSEIFSDPGLLCEDRQPRENFDLKCQESNDIINSTLIFLLPLPRADVNVSIECAETAFQTPFTIVSINLHVTGM